jgi:hypothetical protein
MVSTTVTIITTTCLLLLMFETLLPINLYSVLSIPLSLLIFVPGLIKLSKKMRYLGQTIVTICKLTYLKQKHSVTAIVAFFIILHELYSKKYRKSVSSYFHIFMHLPMA